MTEFSIIIPFQTITPYLHETLGHLSKLKGPVFEVILLPDAIFSTEELNGQDYPLRVIPTGVVSPAIKVGGRW